MTTGEWAIEQVLATWGGELAVTHYDAPTGAWIVIAIHSTRLGPGAGGTRMKRYQSLAEATLDACKLATGMTLKFAAANFPLGGGKAVIALPAAWNPSERPGLLRRYGALVRQLRGLYITGPDVGTSSEDMDQIAETGAPYVFARTPTSGGAGSSGPPTALGVFSGIEAAVAHVFGGTLRSRRVLVQGAGGVGEALIARLLDAGAEVLFSDVDPAAVGRLAHDPRLRAVPPDQTVDTPCDVFAPCAFGGVLNAGTIARLRCRIVAGAANNQLALPEDAALLHARGIVYVPDFVINSGGAMYVVGVEALGWPATQAEAHVRRIGDTVLRVLQQAEAAGITTEAAGRQLAELYLAQAQPVAAGTVVTTGSRPGPAA